MARDKSASVFALAVLLQQNGKWRLLPGRAFEKVSRKIKRSSAPGSDMA
jgi:hypothetical protein